jgi:hypothetical protein
MGIARSAESATVTCSGVRSSGTEGCLRPVQLGVPDVRSPQFAQQAHDQSAAVESSRSEADDQGFIDALSNGA